MIVFSAGLDTACVGVSANISKTQADKLDLLAIMLLLCRRFAHLFK